MGGGELSGPVFRFGYEEVFHPTPAEAREVLGVQGAEYVSTREESLIFTERKAPPARRK